MPAATDRTHQSVRNFTAYRQGRVTSALKSRFPWGLAKSNFSSKSCPDDFQPFFQTPTKQTYQNHVQTISSIFFLWTQTKQNLSKSFPTDCLSLCFWGLVASKVWSSFSSTQILQWGNNKDDDYQIDVRRCGE